MNIKFIDFKKVFGEKYFGIAAIVLDDKIMLRYKVGDDYIDAFEIDSNFTKSAIDQVIRDHVKPLLDDGIPF